MSVVVAPPALPPLPEPPLPWVREMRTCSTRLTSLECILEPLGPRTVVRTLPPCLLRAVITQEKARHCAVSRAVVRSRTFRRERASGPYREFPWSSVLVFLTSQLQFTTRAEPLFLSHFRGKILNEAYLVDLRPCRGPPSGLRRPFSDPNCSRKPSRKGQTPFLVLP